MAARNEPASKAETSTREARAPQGRPRSAAKPAKPAQRPRRSRRSPRRRRRSPRPPRRPAAGRRPRRPRSPRAPRSPHRPRSPSPRSQPRAARRRPRPRPRRGRAARAAPPPAPKPAPRSRSAPAIDEALTQEGSQALRDAPARGARAPPQGDRPPRGERAQAEPARHVGRPLGLLVPHGRRRHRRDGAREGVPVRLGRGPRAVRDRRGAAPPLRRRLRHVRVVRASRSRRERLEVVPHARLCVRCKENEEKAGRR